jgi:hypothetical protein
MICHVVWYHFVIVTHLLLVCLIGLPSKLIASCTFL